MITDEKLKEAVDYLRSALSYRPEVVEAFNFEGAAHLTTVLNAVEAQRQPVSDEKLKEAMNIVRRRCDPNSAYMSGLSPIQSAWATIESALSELETLRAASEWKPIETAPTDERILIYYDNGEVTLCDENDNDGSWVAYEKDNWCDTPKYWMPLPTPPAQEVK